jgi:hypothetical protein
VTSRASQRRMAERCGSHPWGWRGHSAAGQVSKIHQRERRRGGP